ncbi:GspE/PulE family protein [Luteimonas sp. BDR2-5]|uniref:GspE/PulE family protein n=1 Tax=Proluteimonas luteida TaxID=2878685 RepID=UPI001E407FEE|nr:GspE/PulE family protein [Luteimonas sp. BDR2-5]MCD9026843.1 GspE/PulE family protein [Luteimonas sp. BDR2-5]
MNVLHHETQPLFGVSAEQIHELRLRAVGGDRSWALLLQDELGLQPSELVDALAAMSGIEPIGTEALYGTAVDFGLLSYVDCVRRSCVLLRDDAGALMLVLADPFSQETARWARASLQAAYEVRLAHPDHINAVLAGAEQAVRATERTFADGDDADEQVDGETEILSLEAIAADSSPVVKLVSSILYDALKQRASDIHLKSSPLGMAVKFRVDGVLVGVSDISGVDVAQRLISRIKVMSSLDIAERRVPQDGRFRVRTRASHVDFRVSIMPSIHGEDAVLRLLDRSTLTGNHESMLRLTDLALGDDALSTLRRLVAQPYGMILVTGPTGSGKTTTLYAAIQEINHGHENIITIEDPVEYQLPGVLQIPVNEKKGLTFARGLRSILRHDPDKIMVGEIRDEETAQISVQAALTGHLVLTTVHANNVFDVVGRLLHMGVDAYSLASALVGVWAQRLLRLNCPQCVRPYPPDAEMMAVSGLAASDIAGRDLRAGAGCAHCRGTGYKGRTVVAEYLVMNDVLRDLVANKAPVTSMRAEANRLGGRTLRSEAIDLFLDGRTTLAEVNRVTFAE